MLFRYVVTRKDTVSYHDSQCAILLFCIVKFTCVQPRLGIRFGGDRVGAKCARSHTVKVGPNFSNDDSARAAEV